MVNAAAAAHPPKKHLLTDVGVTLLAALFAVLLVLLTGEIRPSDGDNDSLLRIVQVRDLLAGQGWFDLTQYRMGPEGGFVMHWSRLVDLPLALLMTIGRMATGSAAAGEAFAIVAWPAILFAIALLLVIRMARQFSGEAAVMPAAVIGALTLYSTGVFKPGAVDHHNIQLVLIFAATHFALSKPNWRNGFAVGGFAALTVAIGMETLPLVAALCTIVAVSYLVRGASQRRLAAGTGSGFALVGAAAFFSTVAPSNWFDVHCDAYSSAQLLIAVVSGAGLVAVTAVPASNTHRSFRIAALLMLAATAGAVALTAFPQCLADPYAALDERLKTIWLSRVQEAQPVASVLINDPVLFARYYITPVLALAVLLADLAGKRRRSPNLLSLAAVLAAAIAVSFWQVRGGNFAIAIAAVPLSAWVGRLRFEADSGERRAVLKMIAAWLVSLNYVWFTATAFASVAVDNWRGVASDPAETSEEADCYAGETFAGLARMRPATVLAVSNLGSAVLNHTRHRVLAGPYHRNEAGNSATLDAFLTEATGARQVIDRYDVDIVVHCPGNAESGLLAKIAPNGLMAQLMKDNPPSWLILDEDVSNSNLRVYRVAER